MPEMQLRACLAVVASNVPGGTASPEQAGKLSQLFYWPEAPDAKCRGSHPAPFLRTIRTYERRVHFPHFWRAFVKTARVVASSGVASPTGNASNIAESSGDKLVSELEAFRDDILRSLEPSDVSNALASRSPRIAASHLAQMLRDSAAKPGCMAPAFWHSLADLADVRGSAQMSLEELSAAMASWLQQALEWHRSSSSTALLRRRPHAGQQQAVASRGLGLGDVVRASAARPTPEASGAELEPDGRFNSSDWPWQKATSPRQQRKGAGLQEQDSSQASPSSPSGASRASSAPRGEGRSQHPSKEWERCLLEGMVVKEAMPASPREEPSFPGSGGGNGLPVHVNIYDVTHTTAVKWMNAVFANWMAPVKLGGAFHAAVEVQGLEWSFGRTFRETLPGISCGLPRSDPQHNFRQTICLGRTKLSMEDVAALIRDLVEDYPGQEYDLLRRNCCHFADDFCQRLGVGPIPGWVHRLARLGAGADGVMQAMLGSSACGGFIPTAGDLCYLSSLGSVSGKRVMTAEEEWAMAIADANAFDLQGEPIPLAHAEPVPATLDGLSGDGSSGQEGALVGPL